MTGKCNDYDSGIYEGNNLIANFDPSQPASNPSTQQINSEKRGSGHLGCSLNDDPDYDNEDNCFDDQYYSPGDDWHIDDDTLMGAPADYCSDDENAFLLANVDW